MPGQSDTGWQLPVEYLDRALELAEPERSAWLDALQRDDPRAAAQVRELLVVRDRPEFKEFLSGPPPRPPADVTEATLAGRRVGPYIVDAEIGRGGSGSVWRAHRVDGHFAGTVAIKFVHPLWIGRTGEQRFRSEGRLLARLDHPNIARLIDAGVLDSTQPYLVLEYVDGQPIDAFCDLRRFTVEERVTLFLAVLAAVAHAHQHLVIHRDLKPENVFVAGDGTVKLLDFGIAKLLDEDTGSAALTRSGATALTPRYAAPEQLLGQPITTATDVYALGLVLYVLLTGRHPIDDKVRSSADIVHAVVTLDPARASAVATLPTVRAPALEGDLDNILAKALRKEPAERYPTAGAFADDLRRFLTHEPVHARPDTVPYRVAKFVRRHRGGVAGAALTVVALVAATVTTSLQTIEAKRQRDAAQFETRRAEAANEFLNLLLLSDGGPDRPPLTSVARLELGARMLEAQYGDDPRFAGRMLVQLARQFRGNDSTARAIALDARAYELGKQAGDGELMAVAQCTAALAEAQGGVIDHTPQRLADAAALMARLPSAPVSLQVDCRQAEAELELQRGNTARAEALLVEARRLLENAGQMYRAAYTSVLNDLGGIYNATSRYPDALAMARLVGATHERFGRGGTVARLMSLHNESVVLYGMGEVRESETLLENVLARSRAIEGEASQPLSMHANHADKLARLGRADEALEIARATGLRARQMGNVQWLLLALRVEVTANLALRRPADAEAALNEFATTLEHGSRNEPRWRGALERLRGELALEQSDPAAALASAEAALALTSVPASATRVALELAARATLELSRPADAERFARDALRLAEAVARGPDTSADVGEALLLLAKAELAQRRPDEARAALERAVRCLANGLGAGHGLTAEAQALLRSGAGVAPSGPA